MDKIENQSRSFSVKLREAIRALIEQTDPINSLKTKNISQFAASTDRDYRLPIPGTTIHKKYKDQTYTVLVLNGNFEFQNKRYKSLSAIAKEITGSHWNGFQFFGLEKREGRSRS
jgi:hypothetical protein